MFYGMNSSCHCISKVRVGRFWDELIQQSLTENPFSLEKHWLIPVGSQPLILETEL